MPPLKPGQVLVACPYCGHGQPEWQSAFSTHCRKCGRHYRVQEVLHPAPNVPARSAPQRRVACFECGAELVIPASATSTMCKRCSAYVDLHDYSINTAVSKNFKTKGHFAVEAKGYVFNTETVAAHVEIRGRFHGKLIAERSLTIYTGAELKGSVSAARLIIPAENRFWWPTTLIMGSAEIAGEVTATLEAAGAVILKSTARWFGNLAARNLLVEEGAVIEGRLRVGRN